MHENDDGTDTKRAYQPPEIEETAPFEELRLGCLHLLDGGGDCQEFPGSS